MKKVKINGSKLKQTIKGMSLTIKAAALNRGQIGEKTLYRLLSGEEINETVVLRFFQNLGIRYSDYIIDNDKLELTKNEPEEELELTGNSNSKIVLQKFELPDSFYLPIKMNWIFDFTNPNIKVLETLKSLNKSLIDYCESKKKETETLSFENSFSRLISTNEIKDYINDLEANGIFTYSGIYTAWNSREEEHQHDEDHYRVLCLDSTFKLALYFSRTNISNKFIAAINIGTPPPPRIGKVYSNIIVNGDFNYYNNDGELDEIPF